MAKLSNINGRFAVEDDGAIQFNGSAGQDGYVLESRGDSSPPVWTDRDTGNVIGTGTENKVVRWNAAPATGDSQTIGNGPITFSSSGATATSTFAGQINLDGTNQIYFVAQTGETNTEAMRIVRSSDTMFFTYGVNANEEAFSYDSSGNTTFAEKVGIGISPGAQLHNYSTAATNVFITGYGTAAQNDWGAQNCMFVGTDNGLLISKANAANNTNRIFNFYNDSSGNAQFYMHASAATAAVKIQASGNSYFNGGNVGIGVTSLQSWARLQVAGTAGAQTGAKQALYVTSPSTTAGEGVGMRMSAASGSHEAVGIIGVVNNASGNSGSMTFHTYNAGADIPERMRIDNVGNVGIGDISPQGKLEVNNRNTATGAALFIKGGEDDLSPIAGQYTGLAFGYGGGDIYNNGAILWEFTNTAANGKLHFAVNPTAGDGTANLTDSKMTILDSGNVGIGTNSPDSKLNIEGTKTVALSTMADFLTFGLTVDDNTAFDTAGIGGGITFRAKRNVGGVQTVYGAIDVLKESIAGDSYTGSMRFYTNQNSTGVPLERLRINSSGNVIQSGTSPQYQFVTPNNFNFQIAVQENVSNALEITPSTAVGGTTFSTPAVIINSSRRIGIGTTAPSSKLSVTGEDNGTLEFTTTLGSTKVPSGTTGSLSTAPRNKTILTGYSTVYTGVTGAALAPSGFLQFNSGPGWTGSQRNWAITSGYDIGGTQSGAGGNKLAILLGDTQNFNPELGNNGAVGAGTGDGVGTSVACYWDNQLNMNLSDTSRLRMGGGGSAGFPMLTPLNDKNTGIWYPTSDTWAISTAGEERFRISSGGNVTLSTANCNMGIGTTSLGSISGGCSTITFGSTAAALSGGILFQANGTNRNGTYWESDNMRYQNIGDFSHTFYKNNSTVLFTIATTGTVTAVGDVVAYSDKKLKKNIKTLDGSKVYDMRGVSFTRKDTGKNSSGVIAQEIEKIAPELVNETDGTLGVAYGNLTGYLIEAIKELKAEIEELKSNKCNCNK